MSELSDIKAAEIAGLLKELLGYAPSWAVERHGLDVETDEAIDLLKGRTTTEADPFFPFENLFRLNPTNYDSDGHSAAWVRLLIDGVIESVNEEEIVTAIVRRIAGTGGFTYGNVDILDTSSWTKNNPWIVSETEVDEWINNPEENFSRDRAYGLVRSILGIDNAV